MSDDADEQEVAIALGVYPLPSMLDPKRYSYLLSDDADEQEVAIALGVQHARERVDQLERDSLASSYQDKMDQIYQ